LLLIMIKEAAPSPSHLGKINGMAASTGGACRTIASPVAGMLYGMGSQIRFTPLAWWCSALVAIIGAAQVPWIERQKDKKAVVRTAAAWAENATTSTAKNGDYNRTRVQVREVEEEEA